LLLLLPEGISIGSSDSGVVIGTATFVRDVGPAWLLETQEPPLLQVVYGPWLGVLQDAHPLVVVPLVSTMILAALTSALAARVVQSSSAGVLAGLLLLAMATPIPQSRLLPLYPAFIAFGMLGIWLAARFVREESAPRALALGAAFSILLAVLAHGAGLYFLTLLGAVVVFVTDRGSFKRFVELLLVQVVVLLPWIVAHLWIGGLHRFLSPRSTWFTSEGHLARVTADYWGQSVQSAGDIVTFLPEQFFGALGWTAWIVVPLAAAGFFKLSRRSQVFVVVAAAALVAPLVLYGMRVFARYFYPLLPGLAILAAVGVGAVSRLLRRAASKPAITFAHGLVVLLVAALYVAQLTSAHAVAERESRAPERTDLRRIDSLIDDGRAVIATRRSVVLTLEAPQAIVLYADMLGEREYISYMTWERDDMLDVFRRRNIGWALVRKPVARELRYNATWLGAGYGLTPTYTRRLESDPMSCLAYNGTRYKLYRLQPLSGDRGARSCDAT
jgi:hypothetical protein